MSNGNYSGDNVPAHQADDLPERSGNTVRDKLFREMLLHLASDQAQTLQYYAVPGKPDPMIEREGADRERCIVLRTPDNRYGIGIHFLKNDPDWQSKGHLRMEPRGEEDQLQMVILEKAANMVTSVKFTQNGFEALTETVPDNFAGVGVQELGQPGRPHRGRIEIWEQGGVFNQDVNVHVGTTDMDTYTPPRPMSDEELEEVLTMIQADGPTPPELDSAVMDRAMRRMQYGRESGSIIVGSDPFAAMLERMRLLSPPASTDQE